MNDRSYGYQLPPLLSGGFHNNQNNSRALAQKVLSAKKLVCIICFATENRGRLSA
jgi:hypothetical protein